MKNNSYIFNQDKKLCTGCGACEEVCRHSAIKMVSDIDGFVYPVIDKSRCVSCMACDKICPVVNDRGSNSEFSQKCYVGTTRLKHYFLESASIGICTMVSELIIDKHGVVFGVELDEDNWSARYIKVVSKNDLYRIRNSKYLQSSTGNTFKEVKRLLQCGILVLYIGTPCQIAGLKSYLRRDYENLFTIDLICHGTFSPLLLPLEIKYWENKFKGKIKNFRFRSKRKYRRINGGMVNFDVIYDNGKSEHIERHASSSPTYRCYAYSGDGYNYNLRLSCYTCPFKSINRYGDLTVGDPWGINDNIFKKRNLSSSNPIRSMFFANTLKGISLIKQIQGMLDLQEITHKDSFKQLALIPCKRDIPEQRKVLFDNVNNIEYGVLVEKMLKCNLENSHRSFEKHYKIKILKKYLKCIIGYRYIKKIKCKIYEK